LEERGEEKKEICKIYEKNKDFVEEK